MTQTIPIYQVDAFTDRAFGGNPAAVCPLEHWLPDGLLQAIAAENNLSETAFFVPTPDAESDYLLRWLTPAVEVDLCGHATLASGHVVLSHLRPDLNTVRFSTKEAGMLSVNREGQRLAMDFPSRPPKPVESPHGLVAALGATPKSILAARDLVAVFADEDEVRGLTPDFAALAQVDGFAVIATAQGRDCDFVSRFFAPAQGIPEDPVTGSAHCTLVPYWADRLATQELKARQISARGGELWCRLTGDRVIISGHVTEVMQGRLSVPADA